MPKFEATPEHTRGQIAKIVSTYQWTLEHASKHGIVFPMSPSVQHAVKRMNQLVVRHNAGDYRHSEAEARASLEVAQWAKDVRDMMGAAASN